MEPYRPWVDRRAITLVREGMTEITKEVKQDLLSVLTDPVLMAGREGPLVQALDRTASSLAKCFLDARGRDGTAKKLADHLKLPELPRVMPKAQEC